MPYTANFAPLWSLEYEINDLFAEEMTLVSDLNPNKLFWFQHLPCELEVMRTSGSGKRVIFADEIRDEERAEEEAEDKAGNIVRGLAASPKQAMGLSKGKEKAKEVESEMSLFFIF
ncbi:hypothetical protein E4T56_gene2717 [Termitomyces sp. T112]|nr:hypothetical protein E4T56_gene2717 [Termitomyces sp. T112]KNZ74499.1 hypothetical protein J132_06453 [Termitomyces sp. J132]